MTDPILAGAEPFSADGGPDGVLVLHGFTGTPGSMRALAKALAAAGYTVELPLLPGHGTSVADMRETGWPDWSEAAEKAYAELAARCRRVAVIGLSMGGALATWVTSQHPEVAAMVVVNPLIEPPAEDFVQSMRDLVASGITTVPAIGSDIADPESHELSYDETPLEPALSLFAGVADLSHHLAEIRCPVLVFTSRNDHVVATSSSDFLAAAVSGPVERVWLERSFHVATQDYDRAEIESQTVAFVAKALAGSAAG
jgi:carboxylesterase